MAQQRMQCAKIWVLFCERLFERLKAREQEKAYVYLVAAGIRFYQIEAGIRFCERRINKEEAGGQKEGRNKGKKK